MCQTRKEIMENDPLVQEIQDYLNANNLPLTDKLLLRIAKHNYIFVKQTKQEITEMKESPSITSLFKKNPMRVIGVTFSIGTAIYFVLEMVTRTLGFEEIIRLILP